MRMPRALRVGGRRYRIVRDPDLVQKHIADHTGIDTGPPPSCLMNGLERKWKVLGVHIPAESRIFIAPHLDGDAARETLLHEVLHAVWDYSGCGQPLKLGYYEERVVNAMTQTLLDVLRENPALVDYLTGEDADGSR